MKGYIMTSKKRFLPRLFSKKSRSCCQYFDDSKEIKAEDLIVKCDNGNIHYEWILQGNRTLTLDFNEVQPCK